ncbi:hypothetical protein N752_19265 [Desulforamulus aquiferis]|nr:PAS domain-containing sensor histidine kinase [Desulforamulus aquiferis]RYD03548.1 hypothetical protein N752_19265 [Desulforamulus aquiferis]
MRLVLDSLPNVIMVLNCHRQIVYCNQALVDLLELPSSLDILGARPGEAFSCVNACNNEAGCGTSETCQNCGAVLAILAGQKGNKNSKECRITVKQGEEYRALDLKFTVTPLSLDGQEYVIVFVTDISAEKRRASLERVFFHDILNTAGSLRGFIELLGNTRDPQTAKELFCDLEEVSKSLIEEILEQRDLIGAECNELMVHKRLIQVRELLGEVQKHFSSHSVTRDIILNIEVPEEDITLHSDPVLLRRVLVNMVKNAAEASKSGEMVRIGVNKDEAQVSFWVNNSAIIPRDVQLQIFQRSFSTKGLGRGLGTYSMKILTERYLKGTISLHVSEERGTTFTASYPQN